MTTQTEFNQLCEIAKTKLKTEESVIYRVHHITNPNGINLEWIRVTNSYNHVNYCVNFSIHRADDNAYSERDYLCPESDSRDEMDLLTAHGYDPDLSKAMVIAFKAFNKWDQCQDCHAYCRETEIPHKCDSCVIANGLVHHLSDDQKFECTICNITKANSQRKTLSCNHVFCQVCIDHLQEPTCPHCRKPIE
jgi:hypothetical protein